MRIVGIILLILLFPLFSGCTSAEPEVPAEKKEEYPPFYEEQMGNGTPAPKLKGASLDAIFMVITNQSGMMRVYAEKTPTPPNGEYQIKFFNSSKAWYINGTVSFAENNASFFDVEIPNQLQRQFLVIECTCFIAVEDNRYGLEVTWGDIQNLTKKNVHNYTLAYEFTNAEDVQNKELMRDAYVHHRASNALHWSFFWNFNFNGKYWLYGQSGEELVYLQGEGRSSIDGHTSFGYTPLVPGSMESKFEGEGWFKQQIIEWVLLDDAYEIYGVD